MSESCKYSDDKPKTLVELFHRLNNVIPEEQYVLKISPSTTVTEALEMMRKHNFSQLPVVEGNEVLGVFSYRSCALGISEMLSRGEVSEHVLVDEFVEKISFARVTDEFWELINTLGRDDAVIAGDPDRLQGVVTSFDVLQYLYSIARPFVILEEIELALRGLIRMALDRDQFKECVLNSLNKKYSESNCPEELEQMEFNDYVQIIGDGRNWPLFEPLLLGDRKRTRAKLELIRDLRNDIFHFKRELSVEDYDALIAHREWLFRKARSADARFRKDNNDD